MIIDPIHNIFFNLFTYLIGSTWASIITFISYATIIGLGAYVAWVLSKQPLHTVKGAATTILLLGLYVFFVVILPNTWQMIPGFGGVIGDIVGGLGVPTGCDWACYVSASLAGQDTGLCCQPSLQAPNFEVGSKTYELLRIRLGDKSPVTGDYVLEEAYAYPEDYEGTIETYSLPFSLENVDKRGEEGVDLKDIYVNHVYGYKYPKERGDLPIEGMRFEVGNLSFECSEGNRCDLYPEEEIEVDTSEFRVPCEVENLNAMQFEIGATYNLSVIHDATFIAARSRDDAETLMKDPELRESVKIRAPSDGPLDLLIAFDNNPYSMGSRQIDQVKIKVWIKNVRVNGKYMPRPESLILMTASGEWPQLFSRSPLTAEDCSVEGNVIEFNLGGATGYFTDDEYKVYKCTFGIEPDPAKNTHRKVTLIGKLNYTYKKTKEFSSSDELVRVDRDACADIVQPKICSEDKECKALDEDFEDGDEAYEKKSRCTPHYCLDGECKPGKYVEDECIDGTILKEYTFKSKEEGNEMQNECFPIDQDCNSYCVDIKGEAGGICYDGRCSCSD